MDIYLVRHGQTNLNKGGRYQSSADKDLNEYGKRQAELLGRRMGKYKVDIIYSSDLRRVMETSEMINKYTDTDIVVRPELREIEMGEWDTLTVEERYISHGDYAKEWSKHLKDLPYPGGECGEDVCKRALKVIDEIIEKRYEKVAIVSSGGTIVILLSHFLGLDQHKRFNMAIDNCSISVVEYDTKENKFIVQCINDMGHLEEMT